MKSVALTKWEDEGHAVQKEQQEPDSAQHMVKIMIVHPDRLYRDVLTLA